MKVERPDLRHLQCKVVCLLSKKEVGGKKRDIESKSVACTEVRGGLEPKETGRNRKSQLRGYL